jgi:hypothetical protein
MWRHVDYKKLNDVSEELDGSYSISNRTKGETFRN